MAFWRPLTRGLYALTHRDAADRDAADEVTSFLEEATAAHIAGGLPPEQARRAARRELGNTTVVIEDLRSSGWEHHVETTAADLRYALRRLRNRPGFASVAILTLALGIGASTAVFSAAKPVLFESLPYPDARRLFSLWDYGSDGSRHPVTFGTFLEVRERSRAFESLAVMRLWQATLPGTGEPERLDGQRVSAGYFHVLGVQPAIGRGFTEADDAPKAPGVVILSDGVWRRRFAADPAVVGRQIELDDDPFTVIGVMPQRFENVLEPSADIWTPLQYDATLPSLQGREWGHHLRMIGRTRAATSAGQTTADLNAIAATRVPQFARPAWAAMPRGLLVTPLQQDITSAVRPALVAVMGAVVLLLLIVCVNVTNLLLGRSAERHGEFFMRVALGAGRGRLTRQLLTESLLLALSGGAIGVAVASAGVRALVAASPADLPRLHAVDVDAGVFGFALAFTTAVGLLVGLLPAVQAARNNRTAMPRGSRTTSAHPGVRRLFVVAEVALAVVLLVGAGLLFRSVERLLAVPPGIDAGHRLSMQVQLSGRQFEDPKATHTFFAAALAAVRSVPGVVSAAWTTQLPLSGSSEMYGVHFESVPTPASNEDRGAERYAVTPEYFATLAIPLKRGRLLEDRDGPGAPLAVLLNDSFARRRFPDGNVVGQRLRIGPDSGPWYTIVGIVGDVKQLSLEVSRGDAVYVTTTQSPWNDTVRSLVIQTHGDPAAMAPSIKRAIWSIDKDQPITRVATVESLVAKSAAERRFALVLFEAFGLAALILAALGIYGVLSGSVTERTREIGIRTALGASRRSILAMVVRQGLTLMTAGVVIGLAAAIAASRAIAALLFGTSALDPTTYFSVVALLLAVSAIACWLPAWRASRVDPALTLRAE